jgi:hypothetical protein
MKRTDTKERLLALKREGTQWHAYHPSISMCHSRVREFNALNNDDDNNDDIVVDKNLILSLTTLFGRLLLLPLLNFKVIFHTQRSVCYVHLLFATPQ